MTLILPPHIEREREVEREFGKSIAWVERYNASLRVIDPNLELVKAREGASSGGLIPGYWHVKRNNPNGQPSFMPITGEDGEYADPSDYHLAQLRSRDLWNPAVLRERREQAERRARRRRRDAELLSEARRDEFAINIKALDSPSVFMGAKTARAKGRREK